MKRIVFLIIATLLVIGLVLPGCGGGGGRPDKIIIGVPYPFGDIQGTSMLAGAEMAAEEINVAGVTVGATTYDIEIVGRNDNEIVDSSNAWQAVDYLISTSGAQFIVGGFRTEAVIPMLGAVFATESPPVPFLITGAATAQLLSGICLLGLCGPLTGEYPNGSGTPYYENDPTNSGFYKYIFRASPFNTGFLLGAVMGMFAQISQQIQAATGWTYNATTHSWPYKLNVAIVGENLTWAQPIEAGLKGLLQSALGGYFGWQWTTTETFGDQASASEVAAALDNVEALENQLILTVMSGPCGITFGTQMGVRDIHAIPVGINVEAQSLNYYANTEYSPGQYGSENEVTLGTYAEGVTTTAKTAQFITDYATFTGGAFPIYTSGSYDSVYAIADAIAATNSLDNDVISDYLRANSRVNTSFDSQYYPKWDQVTHKLASGKDLPAQNMSVIDAIYAANGYDATFNFTMDPFTTNDIVFGPGYATGIGIQWIDDAQVAMWPKAGFDVPVNADVPIPVQTTLSRQLCGLNWSNTLTYTGILAAAIPAAYVTQWQTWNP